MRKQLFTLRSSCRTVYFISTIITGWIVSSTCPSLLIKFLSHHFVGATTFSHLLDYFLNFISRSTTSYMVEILRYWYCCIAPFIGDLVLQADILCGVGIHLFRSLYCWFNWKCRIRTSPLQPKCSVLPLHHIPIKLVYLYAQTIITYKKWVSRITLFSFSNLHKIGIFFSLTLIWWGVFMLYNLHVRLLAELIRPSFYSDLLFTFYKYYSKNFLFLQIFLCLFLRSLPVSAWEPYLFIYRT